MRNFITMLQVFCMADAARHSLKMFSTTSTGIQNFPEFLSSAEIDNTQFSYCNISKRIVEGKDWYKKWLQEDQDRLKQAEELCFGFLPQVLKSELHYLIQHFKQYEGVHTLQFIGGCEMDEDNSQSSSFLRAGFDGEDLLTFDMNGKAWIPQSDQAIPVKLKWNLEKEGIKFNHDLYTIKCPWLLSRRLRTSNLSHTVLPTVSLLQKTPFSPVSCYATGFYPASAVMFWRRSEEEIHEGVEHGEILPNHDETFQMETVLDVSLIPLEDWGKYDCVFQLYGVSNDIITPLDKTIIKTNQKESISTAASIAASLVFVVLIIIAVIIYIRKKKQKGKKDSHNTIELMEGLNQET